MANKTSDGRSNNYSRYKNNRTWEANRKKKLAKQLKLNPGNAEQITKALSNIVYRRKTPTTRVWNSTRRKTAILFKKYCGKFDMRYFNEKTDHKALTETMRLSEHTKKQITNYSTASMFSIGTRVLAIL